MDPATIDTYNRMAAEYDAETANFWDIFPRTVIDTFASMAKGRVLDVGSGPGRDGLLLKDKGLDVVCLDASSAMVELSRSRGLESIEGDFTALPFSDGSFSGVWAYTSLLHVSKAQAGKAVAEIARVLAPNGVFGLGLIEGEDELYRKSSEMYLPRWFSYYKKEEIEALLKAHGFEMVFFEQFKPKSKNYLHFIAEKREK